MTTKNFYMDKSFKKLKHYALLGFAIMFLLAMSMTVNSITEDQLQAMYQLNDDTDSKNSFDLTENGNPTYDVGKIGNAVYVDGTGDFLNQDTLIGVGVNKDVSVAGWFNSTTQMAGTNQRLLYVYNSGTTGFVCYLRKSTSCAPDCNEFYCGFRSNIGTNTEYKTCAAVAGDKAFHFFTVVHDDTNSKAIIYLDGSVCANNTLNLNADISANNFYLADDGSNLEFAGVIDEISVWNRSITLEDMDDLYNSGSGLAYPYDAAPSPTVSANLVETVTGFSQSGTVLIKSTSFVPVFTGSFNVTNGTQVYGSFTNNINYLSGNPASVSCQLNVDGSIYNSTVQRSNTGAGTIGSIRGATQNFTFGTQATRNATLECAGSGNQNFIVQNGNIIIHQLSDASNNPINSLFRNFTNTFNNASFEIIDTFQFETTTTNTTSPQERVIIAELDVSIDYTITNNVTFFITMIGNSTNNVTCAQIQRFGSVGSTGSAASYCMLEGAPTFQNVTINIFATGNATITDQIVIKEFIVNESDTEYTLLLDDTFTNADYETIAVLNLSNNATQTLVAYTAISTESHTGSAQIDYRFILNNTANGTEIFRTVSNANQPGVSILEDTFNALAVGEYQLLLQARVDTGTAHIHAGDLMAYFAIDEPFILKSFNVTLTNRLDSSSLTNFTVDIGTTQFSDSGTGTATISSNLPTVNMIIIKAGFLNETVNNHDTTINLSAFISQPGIYDIDYSGFFTQNVTNFTRNITFTLNYTCSNLSDIVFRLDDTINKTLPTICDETFRTVQDNYTHSTESEFNTSFLFNTTFRPDLNNATSGYGIWFSDLTNPTLFNVSFVFAVDFVNPQANLTMGCNDTLITNLNYTLIFNNVTLFNSNLSNGTTHVNTTTDLVNGLNNATYTCADPFGSNSEDIQQNLEIRTLLLLDELENIGFDVTNLSSVIVYLDDNRTKFDFKTDNDNNISFIATEDVKLRFEFISEAGTIIIRYVDTQLLEDDIRVCVNKDDVTHFEQIILSTTSRAVIMESVFADCIVAADFTRFAFEDVLALKAFTIQNLYKLFVFDDDGNQILLASVDGSIQTFINLDTIEFAQRDVTSNLVGDSLTVEKASNTSVNIFYKNIDENNAIILVEIIKLDTNSLVFTANNTDFVDINNFTFIFDWSTISNVNETTMFEIEVSGTRTDGKAFSISQFFNGLGVSGVMAAALAAILAIGLLIFGLASGFSSQSFSWLGLLICTAALVILTIAVSEWYIIFLQGITILSMVFIFIVMLGKNQETIA